MRSSVKILWVISLILAGIFIAVQLVRYQPAELIVSVQQFPPPDTSVPRPYNYTDNDKYIEQCDFFSLFGSSRASIVMLGDSHTYRMYWNELLQRTDVLNRGIGSDISEGYLNRLQFVFRAQPRICFLQGGGNDIGHHVPPDTIIANYRKIVQELRRHQIKPVLTGLFLAAKSFRWSDSVAYNEQVISLNKRFAALAQQESLTLIDINPIISKDGFLQDIFAQPDGVHLNGAAYLIWKKEIESVLRSEGF
ncbi:GDSL-type esterase/lipase family protein [Rurimicrobium arvi]|uniref:SGNH hydrolase-type esterase domain-containing protein n=1 Tax=Rurimicrobium arvi TaxID=2049916 RepID=A0ABP8MTG2_9BACT